MTKKNLQLNHFLQFGMGQNYAPHRLYKIMTVPALASYFIARDSKLTEKEFMLKDPWAIHASEISYKDKLCGLLFITDTTPNEDFDSGFSPYTVKVNYAPRFQIQDLHYMGGGYYDLNQSRSVNRDTMCADYIELKQDMGLREIQNLKNFEEALTTQIRKQYNPNFAIAALL